MWNRIKSLRVLLPKKIAWKKVLIACSLGVALALSFCFGYWGALSQAGAQTNKDLPNHVPSLFTRHQPIDPGRPVAYIHNKIPITRQDLGEFLIARFGAERVKFLVNRKIIEHACRAHGISVSDAEIEAQLIEDLKQMGVVRLEQFINVVLKRYGKTLYEYKEDVIRPKLALSKFCRGKINVTSKEIKNAFEAKYGPKVQCRMIVFAKGTPDRHIQEVWTKVKDDENMFKKYAREQFLKPLASKGGEVPPIHKHFGDKRVEDEAFSLKVGDVSSVIGMPDKTAVILKCDAHLPDSYDNHRIEDEWMELKKEVFEQKLAAAIPKTFEELRKQAAPKIFLEETPTNEQATRRINSALRQAAKVREKAMLSAPSGG